MNKWLRQQNLFVGYDVIGTLCSNDLQDVSEGWSFSTASKEALDVLKAVNQVKICVVVGDREQRH